MSNYASTLMKSVCFVMILMLYVTFNMYRNSLIVTWTPKNRQKQAKNVNQITETDVTLTSTLFYE